MKDIWDALENEAQGERLDEEMFDFLSAYADGETDARERRLVEAYLREEPDAERLLGFIRSTDSALAADAVEPPEGLHEAILARTTRKPVFWRGTVGRLVVASGVAAALLAVIWALQPETPRSELASLSPPPAAGGPAGTALEQPIPAPKSSTETASGEEAAMPAGQPDAAARHAARQRRQAPDRGNTQPATADLGGGTAGAIALATERTGSRVPPTPASFERRVPTAYSSEEPVTVRAEPKPIDPMAMEQPSPEERRAAGGDGSSAPREKPPVLPDAREKLRETLQKANEERDDLNDSSLNAPRKKSGNDRRVTQ